MGRGKLGDQEIGKFNEIEKGFSKNIILNTNDFYSKKEVNKIVTEHNELNQVLFKKLLDQNNSDFKVKKDLIIYESLESNWHTSFDDKKPESTYNFAYYLLNILFCCQKLNLNEENVYLKVLDYKSYIKRSSKKFYEGEPLS